MVTRWEQQRTSMTATLRQAVQRAAVFGNDAFLELARKTGVKQELLLGLAREGQPIPLDTSEKLARYFRYRFDTFATPDMPVRELFDHLYSHYLERRHLSAIFDEKYMQQALYEILWHRYGGVLGYERHYQGIPVRNEIDLAIEWELAIEVKWLTENTPNRSREYHAEKIAQKIANLCRLAYIRADQDSEGKEAQCWLIFGGRRTAFLDFYSVFAKRKQRQKAIAEMFLPLDRITHIDLQRQFDDLALRRADVFKELKKLIKGLEVPERVKLVSHGTTDIWNDEREYCFTAWEVAYVSDKSFSL